jgi:hypothetical protein
MWPQNWIEGKDEVLRELRRWEGATAQSWAYSVSHSQFLVRLYREEELKQASPRSLYLYLKSCDRVSFTNLWHSAKIQIKETNGKTGPKFVVSDGDRLFVQCGATFAAESGEFLNFAEAGR